MPYKPAVFRVCLISKTLFTESLRHSKKPVEICEVINLDDDDEDCQVIETNIPKDFRQTSPNNALSELHGTSVSDCVMKMQDTQVSDNDCRNVSNRQSALSKPQDSQQPPVNIDLTDDGDSVDVLNDTLDAIEKVVSDLMKTVPDKSSSLSQNNAGCSKASKTSAVPNVSTTHSDSTVQSRSSAGCNQATEAPPGISSKTSTADTKTSLTSGLAKALPAKVDKGTGQGQKTDKNEPTNVEMTNEMASSEENSDKVSLPDNKKKMPTLLGHKQNSESSEEVKSLKVMNGSNACIPSVSPKQSNKSTKELVTLSEFSDDSTTTKCFQQNTFNSPEASGTSQSVTGDKIEVDIILASQSESPATGTGQAHRVVQSLAGGCLDNDGINESLNDLEDFLTLLNDEK